MEGYATRLTRAGGGTALTSLRQGRRSAVACLHRMKAPASASGLSNVRQAPGTCTRGGG